MLNNKDKNQLVQRLPLFDSLATTLGTLVVVSYVYPSCRDAVPQWWKRASSHQNLQENN